MFDTDVFFSNHGCCIHGDFLQHFHELKLLHQRPDNINARGSFKLIWIGLEWIGFCLEMTNLIINNLGSRGAVISRNGPHIRQFMTLTGRLLLCALQRTVSTHTCEEFMLRVQNIFSREMIMA